MKFESFSEQPKKEEKVKKEKREGLLFELKKNIKGFDVLAKIESEGRPIESKIDLQRKEIEVKVTPEGIRKGIEIAHDFLKSPKVEEWKKWLKEKKENLDKEKGEPYPEEYIKTDEEILTEIMERFEKPVTLENVGKFREELKKAKDEQLQQRARQTIREYARQEGITELQAVLHLFSEVEKDSEQKEQNPEE